MAQHSNEHLTTTQLSAYLDNELASDELALCDAHLSSCQNCQSLLADLRLTSAMLRSLPQVEVPRSFVLPTNIALLSPEPLRRQPGSRQPGRSRSLLRNTLHPLAALAAILGMILLLFGAISAIPFSRSTMTNSASMPQFTSQTSGPSRTINPSTTGQRSPAVELSPEATASGIPIITPAPGKNNQSQAGTQPSAGPPALVDLSQPVGRLGIGALLLVLGILGVVLTRRPAPHGGRE